MTQKLVAGLIVGLALCLFVGYGVGASLAGGATTCEFPHEIQKIEFSMDRYPGIRSHYMAAVRKGWPTILVLDRVGASKRRSQLLNKEPIFMDGYDRDEYPPAIGREGWLADVSYVVSRENRSHGASLGAQLRGLCDGVRFQYEWTP